MENAWRTGAEQKRILETEQTGEEKKRQVWQVTCSEGRVEVVEWVYGNKHPVCTRQEKRDSEKQHLGNWCSMVLLGKENRLFDKECTFFFFLFFPNFFCLMRGSNLPIICQASSGKDLNALHSPSSYLEMGLPTKLSLIPDPFIAGPVKHLSICIAVNICAPSGALQQKSNTCLHISLPFWIAALILKTKYYLIFCNGCWLSCVFLQLYQKECSFCFLFFIFNVLNAASITQCLHE